MFRNFQTVNWSEVEPKDKMRQENLDFGNREPIAKARMRPISKGKNVAKARNIGCSAGEFIPTVRAVRACVRNLSAF